MANDLLSQELDAVDQQLLKFQTTLSVSTVRPENSPEQILEVILSAFEALWSQHSVGLSIAQCCNVTYVTLPDNNVNAKLAEAADYGVEVLFILILMHTFPQDICSSKIHLNE